MSGIRRYDGIRSGVDPGTTVSDPGYDDIKFFVLCRGFPCFSVGCNRSSWTVLAPFV